MLKPSTLLWLRDDLRFEDNPALHRAVEEGQPLVFLYILDEKNAGPWGIGAAQKWWLHRSLEAYAKDLHDRGGQLVLRRGNAEDIVPEVAESCNASLITWNRRYASWHTEVDTRIKSNLQTSNRRVETFNAHLLNEPWEVRTQSNGYYKVFTPYWRKVWDLPELLRATPTVQHVCTVDTSLHSDDLSDWDLLPSNPNWALEMERIWQPGEAGAQKHWGNGSHPCPPHMPPIEIDSTLTKHHACRRTSDGEKSLRCAFGTMCATAWSKAGVRKKGKRNFSLNSFGENSVHNFCFIILICLTAP